MARTRFTDLPLEIRLLIYDLIFADFHCVLRLEYENGSHALFGRKSFLKTSSLRYLPAILLMSKAVHREALPRLYKKVMLQYSDPTSSDDTGFYTASFISLSDLGINSAFVPTILREPWPGSGANKVRKETEQQTSHPKKQPTNPVCLRLDFYKQPTECSITFWVIQSFIRTARSKSDSLVGLSVIASIVPNSSASLIDSTAAANYEGILRGDHNCLVSIMEEELKATMSYITPAPASNVDKSYWKNMLGPCPNRPGTIQIGHARPIAMSHTLAGLLERFEQGGYGFERVSQENATLGDHRFGEGELAIFGWIKKANCSDTDREKARRQIKSDLEWHVASKTKPVKVVDFPQTPQYNRSARIAKLVSAAASGLAVIAVFAVEVAAVYILFYPSCLRSMSVVGLEKFGITARSFLPFAPMAANEIFCLCFPDFSARGGRLRKVLFPLSLVACVSETYNAWATNSP